MSCHSEILALEQARATCRAHQDALSDALGDLEQRRLAAPDLENLSKEDRRLLDQFAYRYTRMQDDMGTRLIPAILRALGEDVGLMPVLDRLNRLEQLGWLPAVEEWTELRRIRNEFAHDYPEAPQERFERLELAVASACRLVEILAVFDAKIRERFSPEQP